MKLTAVCHENKDGELMKAFAHYLIATASPLQYFIDKPSITHDFCNKQALQILARDGILSNIDFFTSHINEISTGVNWADCHWKNVDHYLDPNTGKGIWPFGNALDTFRRYFSNAARSTRRGDRCKAAFFLGAAAHLVQDLCVPHHARGLMFNGHHEFELWTMQHCSNYAVNDTGIYSRSKRTADFILSNSIVAADLLPAVDTERDSLNFDEAARIALPLAQRSTAGLFEYFYRMFISSSRSVSLSVPSNVPINAA
jgi:phospholipase C